MQNESDGDTNCNWSAWNDLRKLGKGLEILEIKRRAESMQSTGLLKSATIRISVKEIWKEFLSLKFQRKLTWVLNKSREE